MFDLEFGLYVDGHGELKNRQVSVIEWKGTAQRVAFYAPYVIIFDSQFVEVRDIAQGNLVQIIEGTDIRCSCDRRNYLARPPAPAYPRIVGPAGGDGNVKTKDLHIHGIMTSPAAIPSGLTAQHVFALNLV